MPRRILLSLVPPQHRRHGLLHHPRLQQRQPQPNLSSSGRWQSHLRRSGRSGWEVPLCLLLQPYWGTNQSLLSEWLSDFRLDWHTHTTILLCSQHRTRLHNLPCDYQQGGQLHNWIGSQSSNQLVHRLWNSSNSGQSLRSHFSSADQCAPILCQEYHRLVATGILRQSHQRRAEQLAVDSGWSRLRSCFLTDLHVPAPMPGRLHCVAVDSGIDPGVRRPRSHLLLQRRNRSFHFGQHGFLGNPFAPRNCQQHWVLCYIWLHLLRYFGISLPHDVVLLQ